jgi:hypothetical protein
MAGQIHKMLEQIIAERSRGNATIAITTRTKLMLKGIDADKYNAMSPDDPATIARVRQVATELNVSL